MAGVPITEIGQMNRRLFLRNMALTAAGLYVPTKTFFLPPKGGWPSAGQIDLRQYFGGMPKNTIITAQEVAERGRGALETAIKVWIEDKDGNVIARGNNGDRIKMDPQRQFVVGFSHV